MGEGVVESVGRGCRYASTQYDHGEAEITARSDRSRPERSPFRPSSIARDENIQQGHSRDPYIQCLRLPNVRLLHAAAVGPCRVCARGSRGHRCTLAEDGGGIICHLAGLRLHPLTCIEGGCRRPPPHVAPVSHGRSPYLPSRQIVPLLLQALGPVLLPSLPYVLLPSCLPAPIPPLAPPPPLPYPRPSNLSPIPFSLFPTASLTRHHHNRRRQHGVSRHISAFRWRRFLTASTFHRLGSRTLKNGCCSSTVCRSACT